MVKHNSKRAAARRRAAKRCSNVKHRFLIGFVARVTSKSLHKSGILETSAVAKGFTSRIKANLFPKRLILIIRKQTALQRKLFRSSNTIVYQRSLMLHVKQISFFGKVCFVYKKQICLCKNVFCSAEAYFDRAYCDCHKQALLQMGLYAKGFIQQTFLQSD